MQVLLNDKTMSNSDWLTYSFWKMLSDGVETLLLQVHLLVVCNSHDYGRQQLSQGIAAAGREAKIEVSIRSWAAE